MKVIVVGSGIVGTSTAYHLVKKGMEVVIVDEPRDGQATAAGAGIICPWISSEADEDQPDRYRLARAGACYYPTLISMLEQDGEDDVSYRLVGAMAVSDKEEELHKVEQILRKRQMDTPAVGEVRRLSPNEAQALFPPLSSELGAVHVSGAARVDGKLLRDALKRAAERHGAVHISGEATLEVKEGKAAGAHINGQFIPADAVVVTAGAWIRELLGPLGIDMSVQPQRGQIIHLTVPDEDTSEWPVIIPENDHYFVSFDDSRVVVGATRETGSGFDYRVTAGGVKEVLDEALEIAPGLSGSTLHEVRVGFRPFAEDRLPLLGSIPSIEGVVIANGLGAMGLTMGPYVGAMAACLSIGEEAEMDISAYDPVRNSIKREQLNK